MRLELYTFLQKVGRSVLNGMIGSGLVTLEKVKVLQYGNDQLKA